MLIGLTNKGWDGSTSPVVLGSAAENSTKNPEKTIILIKIIGWMLLTLLLVLGAIQFAEKVAIHFDRKIPERSKIRNS